MSSRRLCATAEKTLSHVGQLSELEGRLLSTENTDKDLQLNWTSRIEEAPFKLGKLTNVAQRFLLLQSSAGHCRMKAFGRPGLEQ